MADPTDAELAAFVRDQLAGESPRVMELSLRENRAEWIRRYELAQKGRELTAQGFAVRTPSRDEFFANLSKASKPEK